MAPENDKTPWTDADRDRLAAMYFSGLKPSIEEMAASLGRTTGSAFGEICRMGMSKPARDRGPACPAGSRSFPATSETASAADAPESINLSVPNG